MKKVLAILAAVTVMAVAGTAMAATTGNLAVSANVTDSCSITDGTLVFGNLDAVTAGVVNSNSSGVYVTCTNGTAYKVTADNGLHYSGGLRMKGPGATDFIPYSLGLPVAGTGNGAAQAITIAGNITVGSYAGATAGAYADTVVLTVGP